MRKKNISIKKGTLKIKLANFAGPSTIHDSPNNTILYGPKIRAIRGPPAYAISLVTSETEKVTE